MKNEECKYKKSFSLIGRFVTYYCHFNKAYPELNPFCKACPYKNKDGTLTKKGKEIILKNNL